MYLDRFILRPTRTFISTNGRRAQARPANQPTRLSGRARLREELFGGLGVFGTNAMR